MVLLQVVVVYDRGTTMRHQFLHHPHHDVFRQELLRRQKQKQLNVGFATNKNHHQNNEFASTVIKWFVHHAARALQHFPKTISHLIVHSADNLLRKTS